MIQLLLTAIFIYLQPIWGSIGSYAGKEVRQEMACTECHSDLVEYGVMHYPAEDACDNCHESTGEEHPGETRGFTLMDQAPALCFYCHEEAAERDHPHRPVVTAWGVTMHTDRRKWHC